MSPIDALSALTSAQIPAPNIGFQPTAPMPGVSGSPFSEALNVNPASSQALGTITSPAAVQSLSQAAANAAAQAAAPLTVGAGGGPSTWGHMFQQMVLDVNAKQATAAQKVNDVLQGGPTPVHEAMVASEEASLSFEFLGEMRNKIVDAYNQVMQMQV
jgi:flagellar hook-basal body complex protein FliE